MSSASAPSAAAPNASAANAPAPSTDSAAGAQGQAAPQSSPAVALAPAAGNKVTPPYASGSLYVGDLTPDVTEALLFDTFNAVGPVASVRVCRDAATRRSLGYAYVNFINLLDAERALDTMNFTAIKGRPCRIMWSHRDPSLRKSGVGNIFVKNLSKSIDNKALFDTFSVFGNILSCKVAVNAKRESLGYGFVQFGDAEAAQNAIDQVNNMSIAGEKVSVQAFKSKKERMGGSDAKKQYTNVYVKNLPMDFNKKKLDELFGKYGSITSSTLSVFTAEEWKEKLENDERRAKQKKEKEEKAAADAAKDGKPAEPKKDGETGASKDGKPADKSSPTASEANKEFKGDRCKGFGFVNFQTAAQAQAAVDGLNGTELGGKKLFVARAQKKEERERELRDKFEAFKAERQKKYAGVNLYVKNLADSIDEKKLQSEFAKFGSITSLKIMHDDKKKSRGFGFVCFSSPDEATKAVTEMNGRMVDGKPLYVALAQRKEVRRAQLEQQYAARGRGGGGRDNGNGPANGMGGGQNGMFQPGPFMYPAGPNQFGGGRGFFPNQNMQPRRVPYPQQQQPGQPFPPQVLYGVPPQNPMNPGMMNPMGFARGQPMGVQYQLMPAGAKGGMPMGGRGGPMAGGPGANQGPRRGGGRGGPRGGMQQGGGRGGAMGGPMPGGRGAGAGRGVAAGPGAAQPMKSAPTAPAAAPEPAATEPLTASMLAAAPEDARKQMIGERLFPLIQSHQPKLAGKITGMLLEMDNGELLHLLESQSSLMEKITEAINVLRDSEHEEAGMAIADAAAPTSA